MCYPKQKGVTSCTRSALILAFTSFCCSALAAEPYEGRWSENVAWCKNTIYDGTDDLPITITSKLVETFASSCRVLSVTRSRGEWRLRTSCRDEGQGEKEPRTRVTFTLRVEGDRLTMRDTVAGALEVLSRCPPTPR